MGMENGFLAEWDGMGFPTSVGTSTSKNRHLAEDQIPTIFIFFHHPEINIPSSERANPKIAMFMNEIDQFFSCLAFVP